MCCLTTNKARNLSNWVLLAVRSNDTNTIKWMSGKVVFPIPEPNQEIKWGSNFQQFGRGAVKTTIHGLAGPITAPTINATSSLQVDGANLKTLYHPIGN